MACNNQSSLFGSPDKYIKFLSSDLVAIEGANTVEKQFLKDLRIPYTQILKGRVVLKAGQLDYFLNHLGLGDNATFLSIIATYDTKSKIEEDNYIQYSFANDLSRIYYMDQVLILTGNSTHRIHQLYLTNPNSTYNVSLDIMVANIDDTYNYFNDTLNQYGYSFVNLSVSNIKTYVVNESIVINDDSGNPLLYLRLSNINSIERSGFVLTIDDSSYSTVFLKFINEYETNQAHSLLSYVLENTNVNINTLSPLEDDISPIIYFNSKVGGTGDYISFEGATYGVPYDTSYGGSFSTSISISTYGTQSEINANSLVNLIVDYVEDNRDGIISVTSSNILINGTHSSIGTTGSYIMTFNLSDIAQNFVTASMTLTITD